MKATCAPTSFIGMLSMLLMLVAGCSAQMVTYDVSNGEDFTKGEFAVTCPVGSYCMLPIKPGFDFFSWSSDHVAADPTAYPGNATYYWKSISPSGRPPIPAIRGKRCRGD